MLALVDCNSFYASCEMLFKPDLRARPVVVLSNNDGCIIARSALAKQLGLKMGLPYFQQAKMLKAHKVAVFSSNYPLYGDLSARVMTCLRQFSPRLEVYSIDEAFVDLTGVAAADLQGLACEMQHAVINEVGIPVGVGIGKTKTLAKAANNYAKSHGGAFVIQTDQDRALVMNRLAIGDVWGIGRRWAKRLYEMDIKTASDLLNVPDLWIKQNLHLPGQRLIAELNGQTSYALDGVPPARQNTAVTRSFGHNVYSLDDLSEALVCYTTRAAEKLRMAKQQACAVQVFIETSRFDPKNFYANSSCMALDPASNDTAYLIKMVQKGLAKIYKSGVKYKRAGVMMLDLVDQKNRQLSLFEEANPTQNQKKASRESLMSAMDRLNKRYGRNSLHYGLSASDQWKMSQNNLSPAYTTRWQDVPCVR